MDPGRIAPIPDHRRNTDRKQRETGPQAGSRNNNNDNNTPAENKDAVTPRSPTAQEVDDVIVELNHRLEKLNLMLVKKTDADQTDNALHLIEIDSTTIIRELDINLITQTPFISYGKDSAIDDLIGILLSENY